MALSPGSRLGPYEILVPLGAGGMGFEAGTSTTAITLVVNWPADLKQ